MIIKGDEVGIQIANVPVYKNQGPFVRGKVGIEEFPVVRLTGYQDKSANLLSQKAEDDVLFRFRKIVGKGQIREVF